MSTLDHIDLDNDEGTGSCQGYVVDGTAEQTRNYLEEHTEHAPRIAAWIAENVSRIALLKNINVDEDCRGEGIGSSLMNRFFDRAQSFGANALLLISDKSETQREGFNLDQWYAGWDFMAIVDTPQGTLMVAPMDVGDELKEALFPAAESVAQQ